MLRTERRRADITERIEISMCIRWYEEYVVGFAGRQIGSHRSDLFQIEGSFPAADHHLDVVVGG